MIIFFFWPNKSSMLFWLMIVTVILFVISLFLKGKRLRFIAISLINIFSLITFFCFISYVYRVGFAKTHNIPVKLIDYYGIMFFLAVSIASILGIYVFTKKNN